MTTKDELLAALEVERLDQTWWPTPEPEAARWRGRRKNKQGGPEPLPTTDRSSQCPT